MFLHALFHWHLGVTLMAIVLSLYTPAHVGAQGYGVCLLYHWPSRIWLSFFTLLYVSTWNSSMAG